LDECGIRGAVVPRWAARAAEGRNQHWRDKFNDLLTSDAEPMRPSACCTSEQHLPDDALSSADTGHTALWMGGMLDPQVTEPELYCVRAGHLGWAFSAHWAPNRGVSGSPGLLFHRVCGFLVSHRDVEDGGALGHQYA